MQVSNSKPASAFLNHLNQPFLIFSLVIYYKAFANASNMHDQDEAPESA